MLGAFGLLLLVLGGIAMVWAYMTSDKESTGMALFNSALIMLGFGLFAIVGFLCGGLGS